MMNELELVVIVSPSLLGELKSVGGSAFSSICPGCAIQVVQVTIQCAMASYDKQDVQLAIQCAVAGNGKWVFCQLPNDISLSVTEV